MNVTTSIVGAAFAVASVTWGANEYLHSTFAQRDEVMIAGAKADYALDRQMQAVLRDINRIEAKRHKTDDDLEQLRYLRELLKEIRELRKGKS